MAQMKEHDWFVETLGNPDFTNSDFKNVGINIDNTSIANEDVYVSNPLILSLPLFLTNGQFDKAKLHNHYVNSVESYNKLAKDTYNLDVLNYGRIFHRDNIFVAPEHRKLGYNTIFTTSLNPDRNTFGITRLNEPGKRVKTPMELAESNRIFDPTTGKFTDDTPENSFFKNFFNPIVMATWDFDADENGNPTSDPSKIVYRKGEYKLDENGNYYTEFLNGRNNYGKQVISKFNILTSEDSWINKYDFFDSDNIKKSTTGSIIRNAVEIVPLFIPYVGEAYLYTSLVMNTGQALATLGKLFVGSDNKVLNNIEAFGQSFDKTVSEYGLEHTFSAENVLNMVGETFTFLRGQRMLAENAPSWFGKQIPKNEKEYSDKLVTIKEGWLNKNLPKAWKNLSEAERKANGLEEAFLELNVSAEMFALSQLKNMITSYQKLGQQISRDYMAITFGLHTYGTAKSLNVSDEVATMLTLGAIAGQYGLLKSHVGSWIFPESKIESLQLKKVIDTLGKETLAETEVLTLDETILNVTSKAEKLNLFLKIFDKGKQFASKIYDSPMPTFNRALLTGSIASGVEMTSFLVLDDVIASVYNLGSWLSGNNNRMSAWDNMLERYANSFLGGAFAGVINAPELYKASKALYNMDNTRAMEYVINMISEGKEDLLLREVDKHDFGNKYLSAKDKLLPKDKVESWALGDAVDNQDLAVKQMFHQQVDFIKRVLLAHNAAISENSLLDVNIRGELKLAALRNSVVVKEYLQRFISNNVDIVRLVNLIERFSDPKTRKAEKEKESDVKSPDTITLENLQLQLAEKLKIKDLFLKGELAPEYMKKALFEMSYGVNSAFLNARFIPWVEEKSGKSFNKLTSSEINRFYEEYQDYVKAGKVDYLTQAFELFKKANGHISNVLSLDLTKLVPTEDILEFLNIFQDASDIFGYLSNSSDLFNHALSMIPRIEASKLQSLVERYATPEEIALLEQILSKITDPEIENANDANIAKKVYDTNYIDVLTNAIVPKFIEELYSKLDNVGYINPEIKNQLISTIDKLISYLNIAQNTDYLPFETDSGNTVILYNDELADRLNLELVDRLDGDIYETRMILLEELRDRVENLSDLGLIESINKFSKLFTNGEFDFRQLLSLLDKTLNTNKSDLEKFVVSDEFANNIKIAIDLTQMFRNGVIAANNVVDKVNNIFGYNMTANSLDENSNLVVINSEHVTNLVENINRLENKLIFYLRLIELASALKLSLQVKISTNTKFLLYKQLKSKFELIPDDWEGKSELLSIVNNLSDLEQMSKAGSSSLSNEELNKLDSDMLRFEQGIYDFFLKNKTKIDNPEELSKFLEHFKLNDTDISYIDGSDKLNDDNALVWYLASRAALNPKEFYSNIKTALTGDVAPIDTQMLGVYLATSAIFNRDFFHKFRNGIIATLRKQVNSEELKHLAISTKFPVFKNIVLLEAGPGAGKTNAILPYITSFVENTRDNLLKNIWVTNTTNETAKNLRKKLRLDENSNAFTKRELMLRISSEWKEEVDSENNLKIDNYVIDEETGVPKYNFKLREIAKSEIPKIIIIDEISDYSELDLRLIDEFADKYGTTVITTGDFDLSGLEGTFTYNYKDFSDPNYKLGLSRFGFIRTPKLNISFRTENSQQDANLAILKEQLPKLKAPTSLYVGMGLDSIKLHFYKDGTQLFGTRVISRYKDYQLEIDYLFNALIEDEKIEYVYDDEQSPTFQYINSKYADRINLRKGNTSKGLEGRYYIVDLTKKLSTNKSNSFVIRNLYTALTRSRQGTLLILPDLFVPDDSVRISNFPMDASTTPVNFNKDSILRLSLLKKAFLETTFADVSPVNYESPKLKTTEAARPEPKVEKDDDELETIQAVSEPVNIQQEEANLDAVNAISIPEERVIISTINPEVKTTIAELGEIAKTVVTGRLEKFIFGLYTFPSLETGLTRDFLLSSNSDNRIDGIYGIRNIIKKLGGNLGKFTPTSDTEQNQELQKLLINIFLRIRDNIYTESDRIKLLNETLTVLRESGALNKDLDNPYLRFGLISKAKVSGDTSIFAYGTDEVIYGALGKGERADETSGKNLVMILGATVNGKDLDLILIPFAKLPNFLTVLKSPLFSQPVENGKTFYDIYSEIPGKDGDYTKDMQFQRKLLELANKNITGAMTLALLSRMYRFTSNGIFYLDPDNSWTPSKYFKSYGRSLVLNSKGIDYEVKGFEYENDYLPIQEAIDFNASRVSSVLVSSTSNPLMDASGKIIVRPGEAFILVGDKLFDSDAKLIELFNNQLQDPNEPIKVNLFYVRTPRASFDEFLLRIEGKYDKAKKLDKRIGNELTAFRILELLKDDNEFWNEIFNLPELRVLGKEVKDLIDKLAGETDVSKILTEIRANSGKSKVSGEALSNRTLVEKLFYILLNPKFGTLDLILHNDLWRTKIIDKIKLKIDLSDGIKYNLSWDNTLEPFTIRNNAGYAEVHIISTDYKLYDKDFLLNRVTTPILMGDLFPMLRLLNFKILKGSDGRPYYTMDNLLYMRDGSSRLKKPSKGKVNFDAPKSISKLFKDLDKIDDVIRKAADLGHPVLRKSGETYIFDGSQISNGNLIDFLKLDGNSFQVDYTNGDSYFFDVKWVNEKPELHLREVKRANPMETADYEVDSELINAISEDLGINPNETYTASRLRLIIDGPEGLERDTVSEILKDAGINDSEINKLLSSENETKDDSCLTITLKI